MQLKKLVFIALLIFFWWLPSRGLACEVIFAVSDDFPPFYFKDEQGAWTGISVDLARLMTDQASCQMELLDLPWGRAVSLLSSGDVSMLSHMTITPERSRQLEFIGPMAEEKIAFISRATLAEGVTSTDDLKRFPAMIGTNKGTQYTDDVESLLSDDDIQARTSRIISDSIKLEMFLKNRVGGIFIDNAVADYYFATNVFPTEQFTRVLTFDSIKVYFGVSRQAVEKKDYANLKAAWQRMVASGQVEHTYAQYGLVAPEFITNTDQQH